MNNVCEGCGWDLEPSEPWLASEPKTGCCNPECDSELPDSSESPAPGAER